jgi:hypothetical protein
MTHLGGDADVGGEQPLEPAGADAGPLGHLPDPGQVLVGHDQVDRAIDERHVRVRRGQPVEQERLGGR